MRDPAERYWAKVAKAGDDECWPWTAFRNPCGYGIFRGGNGGSQLAHRWAYEQFIGAAGDLLVCHHCDNPACQNPKHWFLGSPRDNSDDKVAKGRQVAGSQPGARNPAARLSDEQVADIRARYRDGATQEELAAAFAVAQSHISRIVRGKHWKDGSFIDGSRRRARGEKNTNARLTTEKVAAIRRRYADGGASQAALGREYGVSQATISDVVRRRIWTD